MEMREAVCISEGENYCSVIGSLAAAGGFSQ
jgi:hypothetical protein